MESVVHGDDVVGAIAVFLSPFSRELDRSFNCFRAAVGEKSPMQSAVARNQIGQSNHWLVIKGRTAIQKSPGLSRNCVGNRVMAMAETVHGPTLDEIEICLSALVAQPRTAPFDEYERRAVRDLHEGVE